MKSYDGLDREAVGSRLNRPGFNFWLKQAKVKIFSIVFGSYLRAFESYLYHTPYCLCKHVEINNHSCIYLIKYNTANLQHSPLC